MRQGGEGKTRACAVRRFIEPRRGAVGGLAVAAAVVDVAAAGVGGGVGGGGDVAPCE